MTYLETIKICNGVPQNIELHARRMYKTAGIKMPVITVPPEFSKDIVKCRILYDNTKVDKITFAHYSLPVIKTLTVVETDEGVDYSYKYADRTAIDDLYSRRANSDDILIAINGNISDTSFCNLVFQNAKGLFTPDTPLLAGTKRQMLIENNTITPRRITLEDIGLYDKVRLINAMIELEDDISIEIEEIHY